MADILAILIYSGGVIAAFDLARQRGLGLLMSALCGVMWPSDLGRALASLLMGGAVIARWRVEDDD